MVTDFDRIKGISCHFTRNLAYHDAGDGCIKYKFGNDFWSVVRGNFAEIAILEFCKLFGGNNEKHRWQNHVGNQDAFKKKIEVSCGLDFHAFEGYIESIKTYRDKYLSHLDKVAPLEMPSLEIAFIAIEAYYNFLINHHGSGGFPTDLRLLYKNYIAEAKIIYPEKN